MSITLITSCTKDDENDEITVVETMDNIITYSCDSENLIFKIDAISDTSNSINGTWPEKDLYRLYFDFNNNGLIDAGTDFMLSPKNDEICFVNLISQNSTSGCSFFDNIVGTSKFDSSSNLETPHVQFEISIPKSVFSSDAKTNLSIQIRDSEIGWRYYPSNSAFFSSTYEIAW